MYTDGIKRLIDENSFYWLIAMAVLYLFGAFLYATRTPERFFPGKCDYLVLFLFDSLISKIRISIYFFKHIVIKQFSFNLTNCFILV